MMPFKHSFRLKILAGIMGIVLLFLALMMVVVKHQTATQIKRITQHMRNRSAMAFQQLEKLRNNELERFTRRISGKNRFPALLQAAVEDEDTQMLIESAVYELELAQIPLAVFTDDAGDVVAAVLDNKQLKQSFSFSPVFNEQMEKLLAGEIQRMSGYQFIRGRLFSTLSVVLRLFNRQVGTVTIGFPLDNEMAALLGHALEARVAFVVNEGVAASSPMADKPQLQTAMVAAARTHQPTTIPVDDDQWNIVSAPLTPGEPQNGNMVVAESLNQYLAPIRNIETVFQWAGLLVLVILSILGVTVSRGLSAPIKRLVEATKRVGEGDYQWRVAVKTQDEFAILADSFNTMTEGLAVKEKYRGILNKVVSPEVAAEMINGNITLGGENRQVTTLFSDIRGFTAMTENMEPQQVIAMLNEYMETGAHVIEAHGGVVDKYVGDEIMAIFGAPVSHDDDPLRAVCAALQMSDKLEILNQKRQSRGQRPIKMGIGINTGLAVAGNMGSSKRLNYTVLGESVNVAARLCAQAPPGGILISAHTYRHVAEAVAVEPYDALPMKGISKQMEVFKVKGLKQNHINKMSVKMSTKMSTIGLFLFLLLLGVGFGAAAPAPGLHFISSSGEFQLDLGAQLEASAYFPGESPAWLIPETDGFVNGGVGLFADLFLGSRFYAHMEVRVDQGQVPSTEKINIRIHRAFLRYSLSASGSLQFQVGKFVSPFGNYGQIHNKLTAPFIRPPLLHEYPTMICPGFAPASNDGFISWKDNPHRFRPFGAPVIWDVPYQFGAMLFGGFGNFSFRVAMMNSAPSSAPVQWDFDPRQAWHYSFVAHVDYRFGPELTIGLSYNTGPYSTAEIIPMLAYASDINEYKQTLWGFDLTYTRGKAEIRMEFIHDSWGVPNVYDICRDYSYYVEVKYKFFPGFYGAVRMNGIYFNKLTTEAGGRELWDYTAQRLQLAVGYRFTRKLLARVEYMFNRTVGPYNPKDNLLSVQWIYRL